MTRRARLILALGVVGAVLAAPGAPAATPSTVFAPFATPNPEPQAGYRWGERLVTSNDQNGDGANDIFMAAPFSDLSYPNQGRVYLLSGRDRSILRVIDAPEPQGGPAFGFSATGGAAFGFYISSPGDLNGDGKDDVVAGTDAQNVYTGAGAPCGAPEPNGCNEGQGKAWAFSGATGAVLHVFVNPKPQSDARFGSRIGRAGDVTGDGVADVIIGASNHDVPAGCGTDGVIEVGCFKNEGEAFIFNGATGALFRTLNLPPADRLGPSCGTVPPAPGVPCGAFGIAVQGPGDTGGSAVPDQLVAASSYAGAGREYVFDGATGGVRLRIDSVTGQPGANFGFQDAAPLSPGDVNGDGFADIYANGFLQNGPTGEGEGRAWVFNGNTGALLYEIFDPSPEVGGQFGWSLARTNYNGDATPDLYIGQSPHHVQGGTESGGTYVFDGRNGSVLKLLELPAGDVQPPTADVGPSLGWGLAAPGDLNGDGEPDYIAGAPFFDEAGIRDNGRIYAFMSQPPPSAGGGQPPIIREDLATPPTPIVTTVMPRVAIRGMTARVTPTRDRRAPYRYTVSGRIIRPAGTGPSACRDGRVSAQWKTARGTTLSTRRVTLSSACTYRISVTFQNKRRLGAGRLKVRVRFLGNARLQPRGPITRGLRAG
ncbi:MAG: hypothetical protein AVDCRST_MAG67-2675 [uncultured Solirubrobacteraceae bacterium]|uniref:Uncharacterized protein n=1 Tax=uncultured Solirubrobacteraceae bacterium TaxID=1162706 RepID=A0A6J4T116_9ACTN|nr:MAG: hypothetical protein AVDCRST_MAG67-2675 [uncultured Solirubrobacteraceae bacterium]